MIAQDFSKCQAVSNESFTSSSLASLFFQWPACSAGIFHFSSSIFARPTFLSTHFLEDQRMWSRRLVRPQVRLGDGLPCNKWSLLWQSLTINQEESRLVLNRSPNQREQVFFCFWKIYRLFKRKWKSLSITKHPSLTYQVDLGGDSGLHKLWYPGIRDTSTWSKFGAHGEHRDVSCSPT